MTARKTTIKNIQKAAIKNINRLNQKPQIRHDLTQCPFCGASPEVQFWHGGGPQKRMISCSSTDCEINPGVTGETLRSAVAKWERRAP